MIVIRAFWKSELGPCWHKVDTQWLWLLTSCMHVCECASAYVSVWVWTCACVWQCTFTVCMICGCACDSVFVFVRVYVWVCVRVYKSYHVLERVDMCVRCSCLSETERESRWLIDKRRKGEKGEKEEKTLNPFFRTRKSLDSEELIFFHWQKKTSWSEKKSSTTKFGFWLTPFCLSQNLFL